MKKFLFGSVVALLLTGCATGAKYSAIMDTWVGQSAEHLIDRWGYPANMFDAPNGFKVYSYQSGSSYTMPTQTNSTYNAYGNTIYGNSYTTGGQTLNFYCNTFFEINPATNRVEKIRWQGNNCKAY